MEYIKKSDIESVLTSLHQVYATHDLVYGDFVLNPVKPTSNDVIAIKALFDTAYAEEHLTTCIKWETSENELSPAALMLKSTLNNMNASVVSMLAATHYSRTPNTAGTTYTQTSNTAGTSYGQTTYSPWGAGYAEGFSCFGVSAGYSQTVHSHLTYTYNQPVTELCSQTYQSVYVTGNSISTFTNATTNSITSNTAGTTYTES